MNAHKIIAAEEVVVLAAIAGKDLVDHALPRPRPIVAALMFYGALGWVSALGAQAARVSAAVGGVIALALLVAPAGARFLGVLQRLVLGVESTPAPAAGGFPQVPGYTGPGAGYPPSTPRPAPGPGNPLQPPGSPVAPGQTGPRNRNTQGVPGGVTITV